MPWLSSFRNNLNPLYIKYVYTFQAKCDPTRVQPGLKKVETALVHERTIYKIAAIRINCEMHGI